MSKTKTKSSNTRTIDLVLKHELDYERWETRDKARGMKMPEPLWRWLKACIAADYPVVTAKLDDLGWVAARRCVRAGREDEYRVMYVQVQDGTRYPTKMPSDRELFGDDESYSKSAANVHVDVIETKLGVVEVYYNPGSHKFSAYPPFSDDTASAKTYKRLKKKVKKLAKAQGPKAISDLPKDEAKAMFSVAAAVSPQA